jgi:hypothetical protein
MGTRRSFLGKLFAAPIAAKALTEDITEITNDVEVVAEPIVEEVIPLHLPLGTTFSYATVCYTALVTCGPTCLRLNCHGVCFRNPNYRL